MPQRDKEKIMLAEHILEVRHEALGAFLDARGRIGDYIRQKRFFPHWKIDTQVVNFFDESGKVKTQGAFVGYRSAGYTVLNPPSRNFFKDRASAFWRLLLKNDIYKLPQPTRFGTRTLLFIPSSLSFDDINKAMYDGFFTDKARTIFGGKETDLQLTIELKESGYDVRVTGGPMHKDEAGKHFQFECDEFRKCGLFLNIDYYTTADLTLDAIPRLLQQAVDLMWAKGERFAAGLGI